MKKIVLVIFLFLYLINTHLNAGERDILVIESYHATYPWDSSYKQGLEEVLGSEYDLTFFELNTKRIPLKEHSKMVELAWRKYLSLKPKLVILGDDNALKYLGSRFVKTKTKVVYLGINDNPRKYSVTGYENISGVLERPLLKRSLLYLAKLLPVQKALVLFDSGTTAKATFKEVFLSRKSQFIRDIKVDIKLIDTYDTWKKNILGAKKQGYDIVIVGLYHTIKNDLKQHVSADEILDWTSKNTEIPPFAFWDFSVGLDKTIGGYVLFGKEQGIAAGKIALKMLTNSKHGLIMPITAPTGRFLFSKSQLEKWKLHPEKSIKSKIEYIQ